MISQFLKSRKDQKKKENISYSVFFFTTCLILLMRNNEITQKQNYFLHRQNQNAGVKKSSVEFSYFLTDLMAFLQKETTYMGYLIFSIPEKKKIPKRLKNKLIITLITFVLLYDNDESKSDSISYIGYLAEDIGIGSGFFYYLLVWRAYGKLKRYKFSDKLENLEESLEILRDALDRSNLRMS